MIPYSYNMVDMGGIDLVEVNGSVVPGIYEKIYDATNDCGDVVLYNWKFAGIDITPQYTQILVGNPIVINGVIQVTELDQIIIVGVGPEPPEPPTPVVLVPLVATENGTYDPADYEADGFSSVSVSVSSGSQPYVPEEFDFVGGYVSGSTWYINDSTVRSDIYHVLPGYYIIELGSTTGNRFRVMFTLEKPTAERQISGVAIFDSNNPAPNMYAIYHATAEGYITASKTNQSVNDIPTYLYNLTEVGILPSSVD